MLKNKIQVFRVAVVAVFCCFLFAANSNAQGVVLETLNVPSHVTMYSTMEVSGTFKNNGTSVYFGPVGIDVEVKDSPSSTESHYVPLFLHTVTLQPGESYPFSQAVTVTPDKFSANGYDIVIIYPLVININPQSTSPQSFTVYVRQSNTLPGTGSEDSIREAQN